MVRQALGLAAIGAIVGLGGAMALARTAESILYGIDPLDPASHVGAVAGLFAVIALAAWLPARSASRIDPLVALRD